MSKNLINASLKELSTALAEKKVSSVELASLFLDRIEKFNPAINAFVTVDRAKTLAQAAEADARALAGKLARCWAYPWLIKTFSVPKAGSPPVVQRC